MGISYNVIKSDDYYYRNFKQSIRSKETLRSYDNKLSSFMTFKGTPAGQYSQLIEGKSVKEIESDVIDYIISLKEERSYT
jgi:adenylate cyclase class IV